MHFAAAPDRTSTVRGSDVLLGRFRLTMILNEDGLWEKMIDLPQLEFVLQSHQWILEKMERYINQ